MKKKTILILLFSATLFTGMQLQAQLQNKLPPFSMMMTNGKLFSTAALSTSKPTVLIYFAPDCEHCLVLLTAFFKKMPSFKNTEVLLVTFKPVKDLVDFEKKYKTASYGNVHVGAETKPLYLQGIFNLQKTPFTALYDKAKNTIASYKKEPSPDELIKQLKKIK